MKPIHLFVAAAAAAFIASSAVNYFRVGYDDTDDNLVRKRSGLALRTDHLTGCQYLVAYGLAGFGAAITPRLSPDGTPMCRMGAPR